MFVYELNRRLNFGMYNGKTFREVLLKSSEYVEYCIKDLGSFCISINALKEIGKKYPSITFSEAACQINKEKLEIHKIDPFKLYSALDRCVENGPLAGPTEDEL